ncbi:twin-arginine translocase TatA/TatE family subunit [Desulfovibrio mangrovi]|uniref:twin-arginine translocase TatA/TatE family subunit n=1 Tax=Desulfovibrio mangrovi TaxID=2976983 RepID=UPI00224693F8|nr:twin-arginine translocase TatA/TatE family subunit [Desulfovibrio mangrovi]UZP68147.1 twin-arginine translocase TatA/TatE family subunit [Desulfovibrio mangrovi]
MFGLGMQEILLILLVVLIVFGAKKLPEIGGGLGQAIKNFKKATTEPDEIDVTPSSKKKDDDA